MMGVQSWAGPGLCQGKHLMNESLSAVLYLIVWVIHLCPDLL